MFRKKQQPVITYHTVPRSRGIARIEHIPNVMPNDLLIVTFAGRLSEEEAHILSERLAKRASCQVVIAADGIDMTVKSDEIGTEVTA